MNCYLYIVVTWGYLEKTVEDVLNTSSSKIDRTILLPSRICIGLYCEDDYLENKVLETLNSLDWQRIYIITGKKGGYTASVAEELCDFLNEKGVDAFIYYNSESPPKQTTVKNLNKLIREEKVDGVIGLGGGSSIDLAKAASYKKLGRRYVYQGIISCPTNSAHDGIASDRASILDKKRETIKTALPIAVIADVPNCIAKAPYRMNMSGFGDLIANYTAAKDWELASKKKGFRDKVMYGETLSKASKMISYIMIHAATELPRDIGEHINDEDSSSINPRFLRLMLLCEIASSIIMAIAGSSLPASGAEHNFSHCFDMYHPQKKRYHGEQVGAVVPTMMLLHSRYLNKFNPFFIPWKTKGMLKKIGLPVSAEELGLTDDEGFSLLLCAREFKKEDKYTILQEKAPNQIRKAAIRAGFLNKLL